MPGQRAPHVPKLSGALDLEPSQQPGNRPGQRSLWPRRLLQRSCPPAGTGAHTQHGPRSPRVDRESRAGPFTSVLPGDPGLGCKGHRHPKHHGQGCEQPPDRGAHPHVQTPQRALGQQTLVGRGAAVGVTADAAQSLGAATRGTAWGWRAVRTPRTRISQAPGKVTTANVEGHPVLKWRASFWPREEILEASENKGYGSGCVL